MGSTLGHLVSGPGVRVVTTLDGRSRRSAELAQAAGLDVLDSLDEVVASADVLISVVTPAAATELAERVASTIERRSARTLYVDINSVSPVTMRKVESILDSPNVDVVDASIHGLASRLPGDGTIYLSGRAAPEVAALFGALPHVVILGPEIGRASLMKMLIGGVNKGLVALLLELSDVALEYDALDEFWLAIRTSYSGVMETFERLLPTYPQHVARRATEMAELELTASAVAKDPVMATAVRALFERPMVGVTIQSLADRMVAEERNSEASSHGS